MGQKRGEKWPLSLTLRLILIFSLLFMNSCFCFGNEESEAGMKKDKYGKALYHSKHCKQSLHNAFDSSCNCWSLKDEHWLRSLNKMALHCHHWFLTPALWFHYAIFSSQSTIEHYFKLNSVLFYKCSCQKCLDFRSGKTGDLSFVYHLE